MRTKRVIVGFVIAVFFSVALLACGGARPTEPVVPKYLRNNIHCQQHDQELKASYANWTDTGTGHVIIPVNTPVIVETVRRDLSIVTQDTPKKTIYFEFDESRMNMTNEQYVRLITSPEPTNLDRLSALDRKGIKEGKAYQGMTKEGIRIALGYPAVHGTPSLDNNTWRYWTNRWKSMLVEFDTSGKVIRITK